MFEDTYEFKKLNEEIENGTMATIDGLGGAALAALFSEDTSFYGRFKTFFGTAVAHQIAHNMVDQHAHPNALRDFDQKLPDFLPVDGAFLGGAAYYLGGTTSALAAGAWHGAVHQIIAPKHEVPRAPQ